MKKVLGFLILIFTMTSCYDDYVKDYKFDSVYFAYQVDVRTFVVGEGMKFDYGIGLGGVMKNDRQRIINYTIDTTLITPSILATMKSSSYSYIKDAASLVPTSLLKLPSKYYSLTNGSKFIIEKGQDVGRVTIRPDSAAFLADPLSLNPNYVLALMITSTDKSMVDSILPLKNYSVIGVKYENLLFGKYWHGGVTVEKTAAGDSVPSSLSLAKVNPLKYYTAIPAQEATVWTLKTIAPWDLTVNGFSNSSNAAKQELKLTLNLQDGTVAVGSATGATYTYTADGPCTYNKAKLLQNRKIYLKYKYVLPNGNICHATDTLTFRNRIRDGVNEWQDENPSHY